MLTATLLIVFPFAMAYAAASDLVSMTIANRVPIVLAASYVFVAVVSGAAPAEIAAHLGVGGLALLLTFGCFAAGWMGGGDAKLVAATALWFGPTATIAQYAIDAAVLGGMLTLGLLALRAHVQPFTGIDFVDRLLAKETGIPYGIALGVAGLSAYGQSAWMALAVANVG